ncbi:MAG: hypothetical protein R6W99_02810 [Clostridia bacterium]
MRKKIIAVFLVIALVLAGCGSGGSSVNLKSEGFNRLQSYKEGDAQITIYSGNASASKASEVFNDWAVGEGWKKSSESISFAGYSGQMFEKGKDVMMINIIDAGVAVSVNVTVIKNGAQQAQSTPKPTPTPAKDTKKFIGFDTVFEMADAYKEIECDIDGSLMNYTFNGRETINGVETEHIRLAYDNKVLEMWVDENNENVLKAISDGEEIPPEQAYGANTLVSYLVFFFTGASWDSSWDEVETVDTSRNLGSGRMKITQYTYRVPGLPGGTVMEVGETDKGLVVVSFASFDDDGNYMGVGELKKLIER